MWAVTLNGEGHAQSNQECKCATSLTSAPIAPLPCPVSPGPGGLKSRRREYRRRPPRSLLGRFVLAAREAFSARHIGPDDADRAAMLGEVGYESLDALVAAAVPAGIRDSDALTFDGTE